MLRERVFGMVDGDDLLRTEVAANQQKFFGQRVDLRPVRVILPVLQNSEVDAVKLSTDFPKMGTVSAVAADVDPPSGRRLQQK